jgi:hypothetical protein
MFNAPAYQKKDTETNMNEKWERNKKKGKSATT